MAQLNINGIEIEVDASADTPLLYVLSDELQLKGSRFGCGLAQCGSCSVLVDYDAGRHHGVLCRGYRPTTNSTTHAFAGCPD